MVRPRRWTDDNLTDAVASSTSYRQVCLSLGLVPGDYRYLRAHTERLGLDTAHLSTIPARPRPRRCDDSEIAGAVTGEYTAAAALRRLDREPNGGNHRWLHRQIRRLGLSTTHWRGRGRGWARGHGFGPRAEVAAAVPLQRTGEQVPATADARCDECGLHHWHGAVLPLARASGGRTLCPNCHALAATG